MAKESRDLLREKGIAPNLGGIRVCVDMRAFMSHEKECHYICIYAYVFMHSGPYSLAYFSLHVSPIKFLASNQIPQQKKSSPNLTAREFSCL